MAGVQSTLTRLASAADDASPATRAAIRSALAPRLEQISNDLSLAVGALDGPDPEFALELLVDVVRELPATLRGIAAEVRS